MDTRRDFLKKARQLSGAAGVGSVLPESIQRVNRKSQLYRSVYRTSLILNIIFH